MEKHFRHELKLPDGSRFFTEAETDSLQGEGMLVEADGTEYTGVFEKGRKEGPFLVRTEEALIHCSFHNDIQFSEGTIQYTNGDYYEGRMEDMKPNGMGELRFHDGIIFRGDFEDGLLDGLDCEIEYPNGDIWKGHFSKGVRYMDGTYTKGSERND